MRELRISAWAIKSPTPVALLFVALLVAGAISYLFLPVKQFPNISFPTVVVSVTQNGAAPAEMETQVTRPVEDAIAGIANIQSLTSSVTLGASITTVQFEIGEDVQKVTDEVRTRIAGIRQELPREIDEPIVQRLEIDQAPIITFAVSSDRMSPEDLSWFVDDTVSRALQGEKGVAQVSRVGGVDREINVVVDPDRLSAVGLTAVQVNDALRGFSVDAPGGRAQIGGREQTVRVLGAAETVESLRALSLPTPAGGFVRLADVAEIGDGAGEERGFARLDGRPVVAFQVMKTRDASDVAVEDRVTDRIAELEKANGGVRFEKVVSTVDETRASFASTEHVLLEGMLLAALVVLVFLRSWRATLIAALAMPASLIPTFAFMAAMGFSLNVVTLLGLTLVIGILIDDAIVEIENIEKRVERGQRPYEAAIEGADQIGLAVVATTFTIVVVFTPVSFMPGISGQFFKEFGLTVAVAVLFSLVVARLLTPLLAAYFLKPKAHAHPQKPFTGLYPRALEWALDHRWLSMIAGGLIFVASLALVPLLPTGFQPAGNPNYFYVKIQGPPGADRQDMDQVVRDVTALFKRQPETRFVFAQIGASGGGGGPGQAISGGDLRDGTVTVVLTPEDRPTVTEIKDRLRADLATVPDARVSFLGDWGTSDVQVTLTSEDGDALARAAAEVERQMRSARTVGNPRPATAPTSPEIAIRPRYDEAARLGVTAASLAGIARVATVGDIDANVAKMTVGERRIPIRVRLPRDARADLDRLRSLQVPTAGGGSTPLETVAEIDFQSGPARIDRYDRKRQQVIEADLAGGAQLGQALAELNKLPAMQKLPAGVAPAEQGDAQAMADLFGALGTAIFAGVAMIYAVLVLLFRSFFKPVTILSALPLAIGGAFLGLLVTGLALSLPSLIGFLMLLGLAAKNSILLVEFAIERERAGETQRQALIDACRERARPIVMTTLAMAAGMLPTALAIGTGAEFRQPMAVAVIGGLITSTGLSLVLVPVVYEFVDDFEKWLRPKFARFVTPREDPARALPADRL